MVYVLYEGRNGMHSHEVIGLTIILNRNLIPYVCISKLIVAFVQPCMIVIVISKLHSVAYWRCSSSL